MTDNYLFFNKMESHMLNLKINTFWRLQYFMLILKKKRTKKYFSYESSVKNEKPLVYSCSGCSNAAQMANYIAVQLDRNGIAEMSCIVGVGGNVKKLLHTALSGRKIITIDGCPLACSKACLGNHSLNSDSHFELTALGVKKREHVDFDQKQANDILKRISKKIREPEIAV